MGPTRTSVVLLALGLSVSACGTVGGAADFQHLTDAVKEAASDPRCAHTDRIQGNLGGLTSNNFAFYFERSCPAATAPTPSAPAPVAPGVPAGLPVGGTVVTPPGR